MVFSTLCQYKCFIKWKKSALTRRYIENLILDSSPESHTFIILFREKVKKKVFLKKMKADRRAGVKSFLLRAAVFWRLKVKPWLDNHAQKVGIPQECAQHQLPNMGSKALKCWRDEKEDAPYEAGGNIEVFNTYYERGWYIRSVRNLA